MSKESPQSSPIEFERKGHITDVHMPKGTIRIIYSRHDISNKPEDILSNSSGIFLENIDSEKNHSHLDLDIDKHSQYGEITRAALKKNIPLYAHDSDDGTGGLYALVRPLVGLVQAPMVIAEGTYLHATWQQTALISLPVLYDALPYYAVLAIHKKGLDKATAFGRVFQKTYPYKMPSTVRLRNAIWARKLHWALGQEEFGNRFTTIVGAGHTGLETYLEHEAQGKSSRVFSVMLPLAARKMKDPSPLYTITKFVPNESDKRFDLAGTYVVPSLQEKVQKCQ